MKKKILILLIFISFNSNASECLDAIKVVFSKRSLENKFVLSDIYQKKLDSFLLGYSKVKRDELRLFLEELPSVSILQKELTKNDRFSKERFEVLKEAVRFHESPFELVEFSLKNGLSLNIAKRRALFLMMKKKWWYDINILPISYLSKLNDLKYLRPSQLFKKILVYNDLLISDSVLKSALKEFETTSVFKRFSDKHYEINLYIEIFSKVESLDDVIKKLNIKKNYYQNAKQTLSVKRELEHLSSLEKLAVHMKSDGWKKEISNFKKDLESDTKGRVILDLIPSAFYTVEGITITLVQLYLATRLLDYLLLGSGDNVDKERVEHDINLLPNKEIERGESTFTAGELELDALMGRFNRGEISVEDYLKLLAAME